MNAAERLISEAAREASRYLGNSDADRAARLAYHVGYLEGIVRKTLHQVPMTSHERAKYLIKQASDYCECQTWGDFSCVVDKLDEAMVECDQVQAIDECERSAGYAEVAAEMVRDDRRAA